MPGLGSAADEPAGPRHRRQRGFWCSILHENGRWRDPGPFFSAGGVLMRPHDRGVDQVQRGRRGFSQNLEDTQPDAGFGPPVLTVVDGRVRAVAFRQIAPREPVRNGQKIPFSTRRSQRGNAPCEYRT